MGKKDGKRGAGVSRASVVALGGLLAALGLLLLFLAGVVPGAELTLYGASSLLTAAMVLEAGPAAGWVLYAATALLGTAVLPVKTAMIPYALFFGCYGILKYHIESLHSRVPELVLKLVAFNAALAAGYFVLRAAAFDLLGLPELTPPFLAVLAQGFFLLYDAVYTRLIDWYRRSIRLRWTKGGTS